jgi:hypothetical protein
MGLVLDRQQSSGAVRGFVGEYDSIVSSFDSPGVEIK